MIKTRCDPQRLLPYHVCYLNRLKPYPPGTTNQIKTSGVSDLLPAIPVFEIPSDLEYLPGHPACELGDYILYNGHHRRLAAVFAQVREVEIIVLLSDQDLTSIEPWELLEVPSTSIVEHQLMVYDLQSLSFWYCLVAFRPIVPYKSRARNWNSCNIHQIQKW